MPLINCDWQTEEIGLQPQDIHLVALIIIYIFLTVQSLYNIWLYLYMMCMKSLHSMLFTIIIFHRIKDMHRGLQLFPYLLRSHRGHQTCTICLNAQHKKCNGHHWAHHDDLLLHIDDILFQVIYRNQSNILALWMTISSTWSNIQAQLGKAHGS